MKKAYNKIIKVLEGIIVKLHKFKMIYSEYYALRKKKSLINQTKWSGIQQREFNEYWINNYGKKITSKGHKLYESINGVYNKDYFPDFLFATKLEPSLNNLMYSNIYSDKSLTELLYAKCKSLVVPKSYFVNSAAIWYDENRRVVNENNVVLQLSTIDKDVIKPSIGGSSGKGITFIDKKLEQQEILTLLLLYKTEWFLENPYNLEAIRMEDAELWYRTRENNVFKVYTEPLLFYREFDNEYYKKYFNSYKPMFLLANQTNDWFWIKAGIYQLTVGLIYYIFNKLNLSEKLIDRRRHGYNGSICATHFGVTVPPISVQFVPVISV